MHKPTFSKSRWSSHYPLLELMTHHVWTISSFIVHSLWDMSHSCLPIAPKFNDWLAFSCLFWHKTVISSRYISSVGQKNSIYAIKRKYLDHNLTKNLFRDQWIHSWETLLLNILNSMAFSQDIQIYLFNFVRILIIKNKEISWEKREE